MARIKLEPLRGFRDILEPESRILSRLAEIFAELARKHGYEEVKPPTLERFEIFAIKAGEEIRRSMYVFMDKAGREVALRPEATASIARIYLKHLRGRPKPIRLYYIVNCFRYEEPQRARYREFWQAGVELLGAPGIEADFEVIKLLIAFYRTIGFLEDIVLKIGTTRLYRTLFAKHNVPEDLQDHILHLMDKSLYDQALEELKTRNYEQLETLLRQLWNHRNEPEKVREILLESGHQDVAAAVDELTRLISMLSSYEPALRIEPDLAFARGLAYYTGVIFEVKVPGFPVSIAGGGRYDKLISIYGDEDVPGTGFAIGLDRTLAALMDKKKLSVMASEEKKAIIIVLGENLLPYAAKAQDLIPSNFKAPVTVTKKLQKALARAAKQGIDHAIIIGEKEAKNNKVVVKNMKTREQQEIPLDKLPEHLRP